MMDHRILPPGISFMQAVRSGYTGRIECRPYLDWLKTLPCSTCGRLPGDPHNPIDPSHVNAFKGQGTKSPDLWAIPECRPCHESYERGPGFQDARLARAAIYLLQAIYEGHLVWKNK
jgi:hypothetical protein